MKMVELRRDYILEKYVIIASNRAKRPDNFKKEENAVKSDKKCFFCPGNEHTTPPEIMRREEDGRWVMRVFENKFSAVGKEGNPDVRTDNSFFTFADAVGRHEVIVETPVHGEQLWDLPKERIHDLLRVYNERISAMESDGITYASPFKNHGAEAGASLQHSHSQIIGYNIVPVTIREKEDAVSRYWGGCPYCRIMEIERQSDRAISENMSAVAFTPYASEFPMEAWIFPKRHVKRFSDLGDDELGCVAELLHKILVKLKKLSSPYNFFLQNGTDKMHAHIVVAPRLTKRAGFEFATGTIVNVVPPEYAAEYYRR